MSNEHALATIESVLRSSGVKEDEVAERAKAILASLRPTRSTPMSNELGRALSAMYPDRHPGDLRNPVDLALRSQPVEDAEAGMSNEHALADEMVSVPRQPTEAMIRALDAGLHNKWPNARAMALAAWEAMLSAIPDAALRSQPVEAGDVERWAERIVAENIDAWGWGPLDEAEGLSEHTLAVQAVKAGLTASLSQQPAPEELQRAMNQSFLAGLEKAADCQPSTAADPNESAYERGRFDGIMEFAKAIRSLSTEQRG